MPPVGPVSTRLPPVFINIRSDRSVLDSSAAKRGFVTSCSPKNSCGQWQCSQVSVAGLSSLIATGIGFEYEFVASAIHLPYAGELRFEVVARARPYVTLGALDARMRRVLMGGVLGMHHRVTHVAAEIVGFRVAEALVAHHADEDEDDEAAARERREHALLARLVQVDARVVLEVGEVAVASVQPTALAERIRRPSSPPRARSAAGRRGR